MPTGGPTLLGFDVIWIATILSGIATMAVMTAIYAATTVKDPMARRVKALNERREQLKAGIVASTNNGTKLTNRNQAADRVRSILGQFKMLQDDQIKKIQTKLMQAGIRTKDLAFFIIAARFIAPLVLGTTAIKWNFTKFLVGRDGKVLDRYAPTTTPDALRDDIDKALAA